MFLPSFCRLLLLMLFALSAVGCGGAHEPAPAGTPRQPVVVDWGTGEAEPDVLRMFATIAEKQCARLAQVFGRREVAPFTITVHSQRDGMPPELVADLHPEAPGFALLGQHHIHLVLGEIRRLGTNPNTVIAHEIVHELIDQFAGANGAVIPRWFHEGLAQVLAGDTYLGVREDDLVWRVGTTGLLPFYELRRGFPHEGEPLRLAYAQSYSFVGYLARQHGVDALIAAVRASNDLRTFETALSDRLGRSTLDMQEGWQAHVVNGSGAPWRVALDSCFSLCLVAVLPVLVLALMRRLRSEERAAAHMRRRAAAALAANAAPRSEGLAGVAEDRLAWSQPEARHNGSRRERVAVGALVQRLVGPLERRLAAASMQLVLQIDDGALDAVLTTDEHTIGQVLFHLVDNAAESAAGGEPPAVTLQVSRTDSGIAFTVADPGARPTSPDDVPGADLDFALARDLARELGGELHLADSAHGPRFVLELPGG